MDTVSLIQQARMGDEAALGRLLERHRDHLRQIADQALPARIKSRVDASDIVQQTCLSVFRQIAEFEGSETPQFVAWLRQIHERNIQNAVRDQLQTQKRGDGREESLADREVQAANAGTPSQHAMQQEASVQLAQGLEQLPEDERQVLKLRYLEGLTLVEIHERLGLSKDAVVWLMQKGMKRLRRSLPSDEQDNR